VSTVCVWKHIYIYGGYDRRCAEEHGAAPQSLAYSPVMEDMAAEKMLESIEEMTTNVDAV